MEEDIFEKLAESWSQLKVHYLAMNTTILKFLDESRRLEQKGRYFSSQKLQNTVFRNYLKRFEEKYGSDNQRDETQLIQMIDSGLNNDIDRGDDADESELENTFSNNYQCNDEDSD